MSKLNLISFVKRRFEVCFHKNVNLIFFKVNVFQIFNSYKTEIIRNYLFYRSIVILLTIIFKFEKVNNSNLSYEAKIILKYLKASYERKSKIYKEKNWLYSTAKLHHTHKQCIVPTMPWPLKTWQIIWLKIIRDAMCQSKIVLKKFLFR